MAVKSIKELCENKLKRLSIFAFVFFEYASFVARSTSFHELIVRNLEYKIHTMIHCNDS